MPLHTPRDLLKEYQQKLAKTDTQAMVEGTRSTKKEKAFAVLALLFLPVFAFLWVIFFVIKWVFKLVDYIHLITIMIFGALFLYFGISQIFDKAWGVTLLVVGVGAVLFFAPIFYMFDKDK